MTVLYVLLSMSLPHDSIIVTYVKIPLNNVAWTMITKLTFV